MDTHLRSNRIAVALAAPNASGREAEQGNGLSSRYTSRPAIFAFQLDSLSSTAKDPADTALLLTRLSAIDYVPGVECAAELRYVVRPSSFGHHHRAKIAKPTQIGGAGIPLDRSVGDKVQPIVECYIMFRINEWRFPARTQLRHARHYAMDIAKTLEHSLPGYHFVAVCSKAALTRARRPFRVQYTGEIRRKTPHYLSSLPLPFVGCPNIGAILDMMQAQQYPTLLTIAVEPLRVRSEYLLNSTEESSWLENSKSPISILQAEAPQSALRISEIAIEVQLLQQQVEQFTALQRRAYKLRVQLSSVKPLANSLVNSILGEIGGVGRNTANAVYTNPTLPIAAGAIWIYPRSTQAARYVRQARRDTSGKSNSNADAQSEALSTEQSIALENLYTIGFDSWGNNASLGDDTTYLANLGEASRLFILPQSAIWLPRSNAALNLPYLTKPGSAPDAVRLGMSPYGNITRPVYLSPYARDHHMWVVGQTGTGKSTFLENVILQDVHVGRAVIVLDPHGDLIDNILGKIPVERHSDVIHFDAADNLFPIGINPLDARGEAAQALVVSSFIGLLKKLYDPHSQGIVGPRFEHAVRNALLTIMSKPGSTLVELVRVITDQSFLREMLQYVKDPIVERYWTDQIANTTDFHKSEVLDWIVSKFGRFVTDPTIRRIIGQSHSGFSFREAMDKSKIVLLSLEKGSVGGENATFLGLILLPMILQAALSRVNTPYSERQPVSLFVDEFQNYATDSVSQMLAEARKYRLALTLANQHIGQLTPDIRDAVIGNVGSILAFRLGSIDAQIMEQVLAPSPVEAFHLSTLPNYMAYARVLDGELRSNTFTLTTEPPGMKSDPVQAGELIEASRRTYGTHKEKVDFDLSERAKLVRG